MARIWNHPTKLMTNKHKQSNTPLKNKVAVGLSGGVDSSVSAYLLKKAGYDVVGVTLKMFCYEHEKTDERSCCSTSSILDAKEVARTLEIPHYVFNIEKEFSRHVRYPFLEDFQSGQTPNPCVQCNRWVKFRTFWEKVKSLEVDYIATGHYAKIRKTKDFYTLVKPRDHVKDQTYFLYYLDQDILARILFPLSQLTKKEVRDIAKKVGLPTSEKPESQEICFVGKKPKEYLMKELGTREGIIQDENGKILGNHQGSFLYTLGQRAPISGGGPYYIYESDAKKNILRVTKNSSSPLLFCKRIKAKDFHWIGEIPKIGARLIGMTRYRQSPFSVTLLEKQNNCVVAECDEPQKVVAPGQSLIFFKKDTLLGGGIICE